MTRHNIRYSLNAISMNVIGIPYCTTLPYFCCETDNEKQTRSMPMSGKGFWQICGASKQRQKLSNSIGVEVFPIEPGDGRKNETYFEFSSVFKTDCHLLLSILIYWITKTFYYRPSRNWYFRPIVSSHYFLVRRFAPNSYLGKTFRPRPIHRKRFL